MRDLSERGAIRGAQGSYCSMGRRGRQCAGHPARRHRRARGPPQHCRKTHAERRGRHRVPLHPELVSALGTDPVVDELVEGELIDQVGFTPRAEYAFRHPLVRAVAYESQLKADRAELHRKLAAAIEQRAPESADENAALIAEHLKAAGDLHAAFTGTCAPAPG